MNAQQISEKSIEYQYGHRLGYKHAYSDEVSLGDYGRFDEPVATGWDLVDTDHPADFADWNEHQDADFELGFSDGWKAAWLAAAWDIINDA